MCGQRRLSAEHCCVFHRESLEPSSPDCAEKRKWDSFRVHYIKRLSSHLRLFSTGLHFDKTQRQHQHPLATGFAVSKEDVKNLLRDYDKDGTGAIEFGEFREIMIEKMGDRDPTDELAKAGRCKLDPSLKAPGFKNLIVKRITVLST